MTRKHITNPRDPVYFSPSGLLMLLGLAVFTAAAVLLGLAAFAIGT